MFLLQYRRGSRVCRLRLGTYPDVTPHQARELAKAALQLVFAGRDPAAERKAAYEAETAERKKASGPPPLTFAEMVDSWGNLALADRRDRYRAEALRAIRLNLDPLLALPAASLDSAAIQRTLDRVATERGLTMARRTHSYARAAANWAVKRKLIANNPFIGAVTEGRETSRERVLSDVELGQVWRATAGNGWPWEPYLRLLILTLQRENEVAGMCWGELDPDLATWTIPSTRAKNGRAHLVHLSEPARLLLDHLPRGRPGDLVFTTNGRTPVSGFSRVKKRLDAAIAAERARSAQSAGAVPDPIEPWRLHDLRRTGATRLAALGVPWEVADRLLNHVAGAISGVAAVYQRHAFLEQREAALKLWAAHVIRCAAQ